MTILILLLLLAIIFPTIYFAIKHVDVRKFLAGAFFVSGGVQVYLAFANVSVPIVGTDFVQSAELGYARGAAHLLLCLVCFYFGFIRKSK